MTLFMVLQHGVNHGLWVELEGVARLKVHPLQRAVEVGMRWLSCVTKRSADFSASVSCTRPSRSVTNECSTPSGAQWVDASRCAAAK